MHEMSYAEAILENLINLAERNNAREIKKAHLVIGELLLINPEQLEFCFRAISRETIAENCTLEIEFVKPEIRCVKCGKEFEAPAGVCECGGFVSVNGGKEMILKSVIMEVD
ncbi:hydrogenase maturation nickel metallochaperone HypA [Geoglobus acetivorans]|uniref:Hydrogenase maturation factor HypA n=1 Tax=Geoglobus acetivorans TaxID=565033 RepID=A0ABZ3H7A6_GEOAI